jgi:hypothetical protein
MCPRETRKASHGEAIARATAAEMRVRGHARSLERWQVQTCHATIGSVTKIESVRARYVSPTQSPIREECRTENRTARRQTHRVVTTPKTANGTSTPASEIPRTWTLRVHA